MDKPGRNILDTSESRIDRAIVGALRGQDLSGFEIWHWLGSGDGAAGLLTEADLYPTLYRLEATRLLKSDWHEGERTRRTYRLTSTALRLAEENGWPPLVFRSGAATQGEPDRPNRAVSPGPDSGSWFVPLKRQPVATDPLPVVSPARSAGSPADRDRHSESRPSPEWSDAAEPDGAAIELYAADLAAALDLPRIELSRVRQEIADHLADSAVALELSGLDSKSATAEAIERLGDARDQATRINRAQQTKSRRSRATSRAIIEFVGEMVLWLTLSVAVFAVSSGFADLLVALGGLLGLHLTVLRSAEWTTNQMAIMVCAGAFMAGRLSLGHLAQVSRHGDATLRRRWAIRGAVAVLAIALVLPGFQDTLVVATMLAAPVAFVLGTFRPKHVQESSYNWRGIAIAVLVVATVTLLPFGRLFAYDPNATPGTPLAAGNNAAQLTVFQLPDGTVDYEIRQPAGSGAVTVELWPASLQGPFVIVDPSASGPAIVVRAGTPSSDSTVAPAGAQSVDISKLPPYRQWWVVAVTTGPSGQRTAIAVAIQTGASPSPGTVLGWLIAKL